ncbi:MAG: single-stranded-DNA-specific exonuclease RecJ [Acidobacteriota bacterium]|nr:single-stranded-DNA-specific exonuclease RecJ [Acidobacteriota bacterium]
MPRRWILPREHPGTSDLARLLRISPTIAHLLISRGLDTETAAREFLAPSLDALHSPHALLDMDSALERVQRAIRSGERIRIHGDYDVDGATSTAILKTAIELAGGKATFHIPHRLKEGYGISLDALDGCVRDGVTLMISVDTGIRAAAVVERARELGIDVIITDHHLPDTAIPPAYAVINPNRPGCTYPNKDLCGVGVAFKLVQALLSSLGWPEDKLRRVLESFLKMAAIGTVADVVPLTGENRIIVRHGLAALRNVRSPGLQALFAVAGLDPGSAPTAHDIGFRVGPRINAAGRMSSATDAVELFLTQDVDRAQAIAAQLHEFNAARQAEEAAVVSAILEQCAATPVDESCYALVFCAEEWHRGVLGIVASRLVDRFHRPVFVLSQENGNAQGSGRSIPGFHLLDALDAMPELFVKYGGHRHAAGMTLRSHSVAEFRERFNAHAAGKLTREDLQPSLEIDALVTIPELSDNLFAEVGALEPFGHSNAVPVFAAISVEVAGPVTYMKEKHLRVPLRQNSRTIWFKAFHSAERAQELPAGARVDVAFKLEEDRYNQSWCAVIQDFRPAQS